VQVEEQKKHQKHELMGTSTVIQLAARNRTRDIWSEGESIISPDAQSSTA